MAEPEAHIEYYKGFQLVAKFYQGSFQGRAWHRITNKKITIAGASNADIVVSLKQLVDADVAENLAHYREKLVEKHRAFLTSIGKPDLGQGGVSRFGRSNHCYKCKGPVNNTFDLECKACGWIICSYCAACGCGYRQMNSQDELDA
jgi:hypothetical protein